MQMCNSMIKRLGLLASVAVTLGILAASLLGQDWSHSRREFRLTSTAFTNDTFLPIATIHNISGPGGQNFCSIDGSPGGNQSPELSWTGAPPGTRSFVVVLYDVTANFTHWGMYNIPGHSTGLPENAGVAGSPYGPQIINDFFIGAQYDGPCPPPNYPPNVHQYVFTVYALKTDLTLPSSANFPPTAETLYQALIEAGLKDKLLASASITGLYSTTL